MDILEVAGVVSTASLGVVGLGELCIATAFERELWIYKETRSNHIFAAGATKVVYECYMVQIPTEACSSKLIYQTSPFM